MLVRYSVVRVISVSVMTLSMSAIWGQDYPNKPVRFVTATPGSSSDLHARLIAQGIAGSLGQQVIVDNRVALIAAEVVSRAPPDGYTLLVAGQTLWVAPLLQKMPYDAKKDFLPITLVGIAPNILVVHPSLPVKSVKELIVLAKARPGELNCASGPAGTDNHMAAELFKAMTGTNIMRVPYQGAGPAIIGLLGGQVPMMFPNLSGVAVHVKAGRLRALAVTSAKPSALLPGLPTIGQTVPGYDAVGITGIFAPAKTPVTIIKRLNQEIIRFLNTAEAKERLINAGAEAVGNSPEQFMATVESEIAKASKLIKSAGISAQ